MGKRTFVFTQTRGLTLGHMFLRFFFVVVCFSVFGSLGSIRFHLLRFCQLGRLLQVLCVSSLLLFSSSTLLCVGFQRSSGGNEEATSKHIGRSLGGRSGTRILLQFKAYSSLRFFVVALHSSLSALPSSLRILEFKT